MENPSPSPPPSSSSSLSPAAGRRFRSRAAEEDGAACTGKSCQSCTAGVIADCVAVCCCPCAVVNILALAFFKLPWAVARRCLRGRNRRAPRRIVEEGVRDRGGISEKRRAELELFGDMEVSVSAEEVWLELYEVGHLGFGRVSFTGITFRSKGS